MSIPEEKKYQLYDALETVSDEQSFVSFLRLMAEEFAADQALEKVNPSSPYGLTAWGWENTTIDHFLESAVAWVDDTAGNAHIGKLGSDRTNPWRRCAEILLAGKSYE